MSRRSRSTTSAGRMGVNLTPMIDVVFQLMIYFLLATNFALGEQVFKLDLPDRGRQHPGIRSRFRRSRFESSSDPMVRMERRSTLQ